MSTLHPNSIENGSNGQGGPRGLRRKGSEYLNETVNFQRTTLLGEDTFVRGISKVLIIYTGGTIGMQHDKENGYTPVKGYLPQSLALLRRFHDPDGFRDFESYSRSSSRDEQGTPPVAEANLAGQQTKGGTQDRDGTKPAQTTEGVLQQDRQNVDRLWVDEEGTTKTNSVSGSTVSLANIVDIPEKALEDAVLSDWLITPRSLYGKRIK
ncbi:hypothetical protein H4219_003352 [Mycoemilia scoparia]|uniref:Asparaginase n=1 Tax=Mycoemilia scoparia TaxID=417184 RepID=A0A9W8DMY0_9FUNG|nr:hypothetical protein H4219_003352 [Mycoemilia scoparia]